MTTNGAVIVLFGTILTTYISHKLYSGYKKKSEAFNEEDFRSCKSCAAELIIWLIAALTALPVAVICAVIEGMPLHASLVGLLTALNGGFIAFVSLWIRLIWEKRKIRVLMCRFALEWAMGAAYLAYLVVNGLEELGVLNGVWGFFYAPMAGYGIMTTAFWDENVKMLYLIVQLVMLFICLFNIFKNRKQD